MLQCQIIDDDPWIHELLHAALQDTDDSIDIEDTTVPQLTPGKDLYFIDNTFGTVAVAASLVQYACEHNPDAIMVVITGHINREQTKAILNAGCDYLVYKSEYLRVMDIVRDAVVQAKTRKRNANQLDTQTQDPPSSFRSLLVETAKLLSSWNRTLVLQDRYRSRLA